ncbi:permease prefix domain 1-containing protein [Acetobacterium bakii]|uniref:DUF5673 domain-containing protein n=1 Tax=Acetobacterium bakii TaxID=52689 RepID=A0A0L6TXC7_9FIRM|nr:permease prefix domain 1-containing protein [Acetobacterium bakii]KNZ40230.1 hypothetical protein AKG39_18780 [Acetobacterium bakii]
MKDLSDSFIEKVLSAVLDTSRHQDIRDELSDHIQLSLEEEMKKNLTEEDAIKKVLFLMGEPGDLGKKLNSVCKVDKRPLILMDFVIIMSSIIIYAIFQLIVPKPSAYALLLLAISTNLLYLVVNVKFMIYLDKIEKELIFFAENKSTYIEKLTIKIFIGIGIAFIILIAGILFMGKIAVGNSNYIIMINVNFYLGYLFMGITHFKYPKIVLSERGLYLMMDMPRFIPWQEIETFEWEKKWWEYRLIYKRMGSLKKVNIQFTPVERILIDNIIKGRYNKFSS